MHATGGHARPPHFDPAAREEKLDGAALKAVGEVDAQRLLGVLDTQDLLGSSMLRDVSPAFDRGAFENQLAGAVMTGDFEGLQTKLEERRQLLEKKIDGLLDQVNDAIHTGRLGREVTGPMKQLISDALAAAEQRFAEFARATSIAAEEVRKSSSPEVEQAGLEAQARQRLGVPEKGDLLMSEMLDHVAVHLSADRFRSELALAKQSGSYTDIEYQMNVRQAALGRHQNLHLNRIERNVRDGKLTPELGAEMSKVVHTVFDASSTQLASFDREIDQAAKDQLVSLISASPEWSHADLSRAKRRASLLSHPDKNRNDVEAATKRTVEINVAWDNYNSRYEASATRHKDAGAAAA